MDTQGTSDSYATWSEVKMSVSRKSTTLTIPGPVICQVEGYIKYIQHHIYTNRTLGDYLAIEEQKQFTSPADQSTVCHCYNLVLHLLLTVLKR